MNLFTKRFGLVLAGVIGVGAIATLAMGASFALFSAQSGSGTKTFTAGTVKFSTTQASTSVVCNEANLEPGDSSKGWVPPDVLNLGNQALPPCTFNAEYQGSLSAYVGLDITVTSTSAPGTFYSPTNLGGDCLQATAPATGYICDNYALINNTDPSSAQQQFQIEAFDASGGPLGTPKIVDSSLTMTCTESGTDYTSTAVQTCTSTITGPVSVATVSGAATTEYGGSGIADTLDYYLPLTAGNGYQGATATVTEFFVAVQCSNNATTYSSSDPTNDMCYGPGPKSWS
jgi:hypothetical protein